MQNITLNSITIQARTTTKFKYMNIATTLASLQVQNNQLSSDLADADRRAGAAERKLEMVQAAMEAQRPLLTSLSDRGPKGFSREGEILNPLSVKACPFCGSKPEGTFAYSIGLSAIHCSNSSCVAHCRKVSVEIWNIRFNEVSNSLEAGPTFDVTDDMLTAFYAYANGFDGCTEHVERGIRAALQRSPLTFFKLWGYKKFTNQMLEKFYSIVELRPSGVVFKLTEGLTEFAKNLPNVTIDRTP